MDVRLGRAADPGGVGLVSDAALPQLGELLDPELLRERFAALWAAAGRELEVLACRRIDAKYRPNSSCWVSCEITGRMGSDSFRTIGIASVSPNGLSCRSF